MLVCVLCGASFPHAAVIDGKQRDLRGRKRCLVCRPFRPLRHARMPVLRIPKALVCKACGRPFPAKQVIDGRVRSLYRRSFCLDCSPFGGHNTSASGPISADREERSRLRKVKRREIMRRSRRKRRHTRKLELIAEFGGRCVDCGYAFCADALDFHHRDPSTKKFRLGQFNGSRARLRAEAEKCDLICANCHAIRHLADSREGSAVQVELRRRTKARAVVWFGGSCAGCRSSYPAGVFQFHHLDPSQKNFAISMDGFNRSWEKTLVELVKCAMLCANCHREVHAGVRVLDPSRAASLSLAERAVCQKRTG
jgi:hypothetical protein